MKIFSYVIGVTLAAALIACGGSGSPYGPGVSTAGGTGVTSGNGGNGGTAGGVTQLGIQVRPSRIDDSGRMIASTSSATFFLTNGVQTPIPIPPDGRPPVVIDMNFSGTVLVTTDPAGGGPRHNYILTGGTYTALTAHASDPYPVAITENGRVLATKGIIWNTPTQIATYTAPANFQPVNMNSGGTILGYIGTVGSSFGAGTHYVKIENDVATDMNIEIGYDFLFPTVGVLINDAGTIALKSGQETRILPAGGGSMQIAPFQPRGRMTADGRFAGQNGVNQIVFTGTAAEGKDWAYVYSSSLGAHGSIRKNFTVPAVTSFIGAACINNNGLLAGTYRPGAYGTPIYAYSTVVTPSFFAGTQIQVNLGTGTAQTQALGKIQFSALVSGTPNQAVNYSVDEPNGGTINSDGLYIAPKVAGTFHVRATSVADNQAFALKEVVVASLGGEGTAPYNAPILLNGPAGFVVNHVSLDGTIAGQTSGTLTEALYWNSFSGSAFTLKRTGFIAAKATGTANGKIVGIITQENSNGDRFDFVACWPSPTSEPVKLIAPGGYSGLATTPSINANGEIVSNALYWTAYNVTGQVMSGIDGGVSNTSKITNRSSILVTGKPGYFLATPTSSAVTLTTGSLASIFGIDEGGDLIYGVDSNLIPPTPVKFRRDNSFAREEITLPSFVEYAYIKAYSSGYGFSAGQAHYGDGTDGIAFWDGSTYKDLRVLTDASGTWTFVTTVGVTNDGDILVRAKQGTGAELYYTCRRK